MKRTTNMKYVECHYCSAHVPIVYTRTREVEVESGRSSGALNYRGWSTSGGWTGSSKRFTKIGGGVGYSEGRTYYRRKKVYICNDCLEKEWLKAKEAKRVKRTFWSWVLIILGAWALYAYLT